MLANPKNLFILVLLAVCCGCMEGFAGSEEFTGLSGTAARRRISHAWPATVDAAAVDSVDFKNEYARDSSSTWYRIELKPTEAAAWMDFVHHDEQSWAASLAAMHDGKHYAPEGVQRTIDGPPPLHEQAGTTPPWWTPPEIPFRATEIMVWYVANNMGTGRATYSAFDEATNLLWIYRYTAQHDELWVPGKVPEGVRLDLSVGASDR